MRGSRDIGIAKYVFILLNTAWAVAMASAPVGAAEPVLVSGTDWNGLYAGVHLGVGQESSSAANAWNWFTNYPAGTLVGQLGGPLLALPTATTFTNSFADRASYSSTGVLGGAQLGYNWQFGKLVVGLEGDISGSSQSSKQTYSAQPVASVFPPLPNFFFVPGTTQGWTTQEDIDWLTTWRARVGLAQADSLFYLTGGGAAGNITTRNTLISSPGNTGLLAAAAPFGAGTFGQWGLPGGLAGATFGTTKVGWAAGAGIETTAIDGLLGLGPQWSAKLEYLHVDLGDVRSTINTGLVPVCAGTCATPATGNTAFRSVTHVRDEIVRIGLNYKFDLFPAPSVTAR